MNLIGIFLFCKIFFSAGQWPEFSDKFNEVMSEDEQDLLAEVAKHPDYVAFLYPGGVPIYTDKYRYAFPDIEDYRIGILIDPCRSLNFDCCINQFGTPEYRALKKSGIEPERVNRKLILANDSVISSHVNLVYEDSSKVSTPGTSISNSRLAADETIVAPECIGRGDPYQYCIDYQYGQRPSSIRPPCTDNNSSLITTQSCYDIYGNSYSTCVAIGFTQNAFIVQCNPNFPFSTTHCGTFLEIHLPYGSPYKFAQIETILSEIQIEAQNTSGYTTMTIPLTFMGDSTKVLCAYAEDFIRVGSIVYVKSSAPQCCCPKLRTTSYLGGFLCPVSASGSGPFAGAPKSVADSLATDSAVQKYPYCHGGLESNDTYMCSVYDPADQMYFTRPCLPMLNVTFTKKDTFWAFKSNDTYGIVYKDVCPYFPNCGVLREGYVCDPRDSPFNFIGRVGRVTAIDSTPKVPLVRVTFNDDRTSYVFQETDLKLETFLSNYEVWWVQRTRSEFIVQRRKGFNVTSPTCTFDLTNNRYFPYAQLDANNNPISEM